MKNKFTHIKTIVLLFLCKYNTELLNLTFPFETCGKTEIQFISVCEDRVFAVRPAYTSVLSDQALYCWLLKFIF